MQLYISFPLYVLIQNVCDERKVLLIKYTPWLNNAYETIFYTPAAWFYQLHTDSVIYMVKK